MDEYTVKNYNDGYVGIISNPPYIINHISKDLFIRLPITGAIIDKNKKTHCLYIDPVKFDGNINITEYLHDSIDKNVLNTNLENYSINLNIMNDYLESNNKIVDDEWIIINN
jgi:hypothetical protein